MPAADYVAAIQKHVPAALEAAAYAVGRPVVTEITGYWGRHENVIPHNGDKPQRSKYAQMPS